MFRTGPPFVSGIQPQYRPFGRVDTGGNWWQAGGATGAVAAYQAVGAADYTASKINLSNPGTFDITDGDVPAWTSVDGWDLNGTSNYLITGVQAEADWTVLIQASVPFFATSKESLFGAISGGDLFRVYANFASQCYYGNGAQNAASPGFTTGNVGFAGLTGYRDGVFDVSISGPGFPGATPVLYIGGENSGGGGAPSTYCQSLTRAFVIFDNTLSAPQVAAVAAAMAAL